MADSISNKRTHEFGRRHLEPFAEPLAGRRGASGAAVLLQYESDTVHHVLPECLLTSATVLSSDPLSNVLTDGSGFRFHSLNSPYTLQAGTYVIGWVAHGESYICYPANCGSSNPSITFVQGMSAFSDTLVFPASSDNFGNPGQ